MLKKENELKINFFSKKEAYCKSKESNSDRCKNLSLSFIHFLNMLIKFIQFLNTLISFTYFPKFSQIYRIQKNLIEHVNSKK